MTSNKIILALSSALGISLLWNLWTLRRNSLPVYSFKNQPRLIRIENHLIVIERIKTIFATPLSDNKYRVEIQTLDDWNATVDFSTVREADEFLNDIKKKCNGSDD